VNDQTERALIAALISYPDEISDVSVCLKPEDLTRRQHEVIYAELLAMTSEGKKVDMFTLQNSLEASGRSAAAGGWGFLTDVTQIFGAPGFSMQYARSIREASQRRAMRVALARALEAVQDLAKPLQEVAGMAEAAALESTAAGHDEGKMIGEYLPQVFDIMERQSKGEITGVKTGLIDLDLHLSGLQRQDLIILGGRPAMGKTSLATDIAASVAIDQGKSVCFFSLEMAGWQIASRVLLTRARVNGELIRKGRLPKNQYPKIELAIPQLKPAKWYLDPSTGQTPLQIMSKCRRHRINHGLDLIVIDNIQKMRSDSGQKDKRLEVAEITNALKNMAKELDVPIVAISHLSRGPEMRSDARPVLSDLQESGNIEQDADIVLFVYRESAYKDVPPEKENETELIVSKYRNGSTGTLLLRFNKDLSSFENIAKYPQQEPPASYKDRQTSEGFYGDAKR
jgi:replicative DNA helicase